jgi:sugar phosphate permease
MRAALVVLGCLLCQMGAGFFYASRALSGDVIEDLGWTRTMWASGTAPMLLVSSVSQAFVGAACARFGVRPVVVASLLCLGVSVVSFATMQTIVQFYAAMMILALANAGIGDVSVGSVITKWFSRRRSLALGFAMAGSNVGSIAFLAALGLTIDDVGWRETALTVGLGGVALILPVAFAFVRDPLPGEGEPASEEEEGSPPESSRSLEYGEILRRPEFWILFYALFCYSLVQLGLFDQFVLYLTDLGYEKQEAYGALGLAVGAGIAAKLGAGVVGQLVSSRVAFLVNTGLLATSLMLVPFAANPVVLTTFSVCFGLSTSSRDVFLPLAVADAFGTRSFARVYGLMMLAFVPGGALGPVVLAEAHRLFGDYRPGFATCIVLVVAASLALAWLARRRPARA